jgi:hypothetical protein
MVKRKVQARVAELEEQPLIMGEKLPG